MGLNCGIVGLPNVGKSTLFNALTHSDIAASNYPFCTIDPNVGIVNVPDPRLDQIANIVKPEKIVPTIMEFVDIAGLVAGASQGAGLGNKFLANIRETDAILHVVRCFADKNVTHVAGSVDPRRDIAIINLELILADLEIVQKALAKQQKIQKAGITKQQQEIIDILTTINQHLDQELPVRSLDQHIVEHPAVTELQLLTAKPVLYLANVDDIFDFHDNNALAELQAIAAQERSTVLPICAKFEAELIALAPAEQQEYLASLNLTEPGLHRLIRASYNLLKLITYFTAGPKEVRAWTILNNTNAQQAAGKIHSDIAKGFIRAEIISYADFIQCSGEQKAKETGKWRLEGKDYIVRDGDVIYFRFNV